MKPKGGDDPQKDDSKDNQSGCLPKDDAFVSRCCDNIQVLSDFLEEIYSSHIPSRSVIYDTIRMVYNKANDRKHGEKYISLLDRMVELHITFAELYRKFKNALKVDAPSLHKVFAALTLLAFKPQAHYLSMDCVLDGTLSWILHLLNLSKGEEETRT